MAEVVGFYIIGERAGGPNWVPALQHFRGSHPLGEWYKGWVFPIFENSSGIPNCRWISFVFDFLFGLDVRFLFVAS